MCVSASRLEAIERHRNGDVKACCRDVFYDWLQQTDGGNYPVTWQGLCVLLEDLEFSALAKQLRELFNLKSS